MISYIKTYQLKCFNKIFSSTVLFFPCCYECQVYIAYITHSRLECIYKDVSEVCLSVCNAVTGAQRLGL